VRGTGVKTRGRVMMQLRRSWNETAIDQAEDSRLRRFWRRTGKCSRDQTGGSLHAFLLHCLRSMSGPLATAP